MASSNRLLLVEGEADKSFFQAFCKAQALEEIITVSPPRGLGGSKNTKQGAINYLPELLKQLPDGKLERLGLIVDADQVTFGGGFDKTLEQIKTVLAAHDFSLQEQLLTDGGIVFQHQDGLADFGLWIMPNNNDEGMLENWIAQSIHPHDIALYQHAQTTVNALAIPKFKPIRQTKAEIATWLAWQEKPGEGLYYAIDGKLLDQTAPLYTGFLAWLHHVFS
jgi:hypothetical protein